MNIDNIEAFLSVSRHLNITKASEELFVSQPTLSNRIKALEEELGVTLFERKKGVRSLTLTSYGISFISIAEQWLSLSKDTTNLKSLSPSYHLNVGCPDSVMAILLPSVLSDIRSSGHKLLIHLFNIHSENLHNALNSRIIDVGIGFNPIIDKNILSTPLYEEGYQLLVSANSEKNIHKRSISELKHNNEIYMYWNSDFSQWHDHFWNPEEYPGIYVDTLALVPILMEQSESWFIAPTSVSDYLKGSETICTAHLDKLPPRRVGYMFTSRYPKPHHTLGIEVFTEAITSYCLQRFGRI